MLKRIVEITCNALDLLIKIGELTLIIFWLAIAYKTYMLFFGPSVPCL